MGRAKVTVVSMAGKEATTALLSTDDFIGKERSFPARRACRIPTSAEECTPRALHWN
jgi:hypothetical protein